MEFLDGQRNWTDLWNLSLRQVRADGAHLKKHLTYSCYANIGFLVVNQGVKQRTVADLGLLHPLCEHLTVMADAAGWALVSTSAAGTPMVRQGAVLDTSLSPPPSYPQHDHVFPCVHFYVLLLPFYFIPQIRYTPLLWPSLGSPFSVKTHGASSSRWILTK